MLHRLADAYGRVIVADGKVGIFWLLAGFLLSFGFIRFSVRMIRAQVSWWPGNVTPGGMHIHHLVFGVLAMLAAGILQFALAPGPPWRAVLAAAFGVGAGLTLDEFALLLHLKDVYWSREGRQSLDAVVMTTLAMSLLLVGAAPLDTTGLDEAGLAGRLLLVGWLLLVGGLAVVTLLKGKLFAGVLALFVPLVGIVAASRLARPGSPWAHWRYARHGGHKLQRAVARYGRDRGRHRDESLKDRLYDLIGGAPSR